MSTENTDLTRLLDLRIAAVLDGLSPDEAAELARLERAYPDADAASFEQATAALVEGLVPAARDLPDATRARVVANADRYFGHERTRDFEPIPFVSKPPPTNQSRSSIEPDAKRGLPAWAGWAVAAALGVVSIALWWNRPNVEPNSELVAEAAPDSDNSDAEDFGTGELGPRPASASGAAGEEARDVDVATSARDLANARFTLRRAWSPGNDAAGQLVSGDVVWDGDAQRGYMRFKNLRKNNPSIEQYQLWIFDASRDERYPIDGGVFNVEVDADGTAVIPIDARLNVKTPTLFAVTLERPGGVVVSDRSRIVALARI
jgi:hypothetical protein